ncbi:MAG: hypothetical protein IT287_04105 [Bdellovibrionaceae bacterium]|nr:hypothetical protein [Pseudobdellovibrionaceae bacterium]
MFSVYQQGLNMPNDILKLSDKRILLAGPITSFSYEIGYAFTSQGASVCYFTPQMDKAQRISDTLNDAREIHRNYGRASACPLDVMASDHDKAISSAIQSINGLDIYIDAINILNPQNISPSLQIHVLERVATVLQERQRGKILFLADTYLMNHKDHQNNFGKFRQIGFDWINENKIALLQKNITTHTLKIGLSEETLLFLSPQTTLNESLKKINTESAPIKLTKPDTISKALLAAGSDLMTNVLPSELTLQ